MKKILLVYIEPTPYIVGLLNNIVARFNGQVDIVFLGENSSQDWNIQYNKHWMLFPKSKFKKFSFMLKLLLKNKYDMIHIAGWGEPTFVFLMMLAKCFSIPVALESDTNTPYGTKLWKRAIKRLIYPTLFKLANLFLPGGKRQARYIEFYGVRPEKIISVQMTVDVTNIKKFADNLSSANRQQIRHRFEINSTDIVFLFVGRLIERKGINELLTAFNQIQLENVKLLIIGDGPLHHQVEGSTKHNKKIRYAGRVSGDELIEIYHAADVFVLPAHFDPWGLVINEAMALRLPVIITDRVGCADDLVFPDRNGIIIKSGDIAELKLAIEFLAVNSDKRKNMAEQSAQIISSWTLENEAQNMCVAWSKII